MSFDMCNINFINDIIDQFEAPNRKDTGVDLYLVKIIDFFQWSL